MRPLTPRDRALLAWAPLAFALALAAIVVLNCPWWVAAGLRAWGHRGMP